MTVQALAAPQIAARISAALLGGYAFTWGLIAFVMAASYGAGMEFHDAESLASILGLLFYLVVFLWAFSARRLLPVWLVLAGGGAVMTGLAFLLQARIVAP